MQIARSAQFICTKHVLKSPTDGTSLLGTVRARRATARLDAHRWTRRSGARVAVRSGGGRRGGAESAAADRRAGRFEETDAGAPRRNWPNAFASTRWRGPWRKSTPAASTRGTFIRPAGRRWSRRSRSCDPLPDYLLLDAIELDLPIEQKALIHGDARSISIAAASILAKVDRDRRMEEFDQLYPQYGLAQNKGYGTPDHLEALRRHGPSPLHRFSYAPVREARCWAAGAEQTPLPLGCSSECFRATETDRNSTREERR